VALAVEWRRLWDGLGLSGRGTGIPIYGQDHEECC
jgi:hypothetical protein